MSSAVVAGAVAPVIRTKRLTTVSQVEAFFASMRPGGAT